MRTLVMPMTAAALLLGSAARAQCPVTIGAFPYNEGFETAAAWSSGGTGNDWAWGTPAKPVISGAGGGTKCWVIGGLTASSYNLGEQSWLESPCFDFSALPVPFISFKLFWECERIYDGLGFQYSLNQGATWSNVGSASDQPDCYTQNWFNTTGINNLTLASPGEGWSGRVGTTVGSCVGGQGSGAWVTASHCLAFLGGAPSVKFRFVFGAGTTCNNYDGVAVDDIFIGVAPVPDPAFQYACFGNEFEVSATYDCGIAWQWDFGDPASGAANTSTAQLPLHTYSAPGSYTLTFTQFYACRPPAVMQAPIIILDLQLNITQPSCGSNNGAIEAIVSGAPGPVTFLSGGVWTPTYNLTGLGPGNYNFVANSPGACPIGPGGPITLAPASQPPTASATFTAPTCNGAADGTIAVAAAGGTPGYTYTWLPAAGSGSTASNVAAGTYACTITDAALCSATVSVTVTEPPPVAINAQDDTAICAGEAIGLSATASGGTPAYTFTWLPAGPDVSPTATTTYTVSATDANGCASGTDDVVVSVGDVATPTFTVADTLGCSPHCATFAASSVADELVWDFGDGTVEAGTDAVQHCYGAGGVYSVTLTATSADGCSGSWTLLDAVDVIQSPTAAFAASPAVTTTERPVISFFDLSTGADSIWWHFGVGDSTSSAPAPTFTYDSVACYTVRLVAVNAFGCSSDAVSSVCIEAPFGLWVPNAITANGDDYNDRFFAVTTVAAPREFELLIFNRWGQLVFQSDRPDAHWDAAGVPDGIYAWKLRMRDTLGNRHERVGHVTVLR